METKNEGDGGVDEGGEKLSAANAVKIEEKNGGFGQGPYGRGDWGQTELSRMVELQSADFCKRERTYRSSNRGTRLLKPCPRL